MCIRKLAIEATRGVSTKPCLVNLRKGVHYLKQTIYLTPQDSNLQIQNYNGEMAEISGWTGLFFVYLPVETGLFFNYFRSDSANRYSLE